MAARFQGLSKTQIACLHGHACWQVSNSEWAPFHTGASSSSTVNSLIERGLLEERVFFKNGYGQPRARLTAEGRAKAEAYQAELYPGESIAETLQRKRAARDRRQEHARAERERRQQLAREIAGDVGALTGNAQLTEALRKGRYSFSLSPDLTITADDLAAVLDGARGGEHANVTATPTSSLEQLLD